MTIDERIEALWKDHKIVFYILLPLVALAYYRNVVIELLVSSGNKIIGKTSDKSNQLKSDQDVANAKADQIIHDADAAAANKPAVDENWDRK